MKENEATALDRDHSAWKRVIEGLGQPVFVLSPDQRIVFLNQAAVAVTDRLQDEIIGQKCCAVFHGTDSPPEACPLEKMRASNRPESADMVSEALGKTFLVTCSPLFDVAGRLEGAVHLMTDTTALTQAQALLSGQERLLEMCVGGPPLPEVLTELVRLIESQAPGMLGSILLLDDDGDHIRHGAAPSLPAEYVAAVGSVPIGPCAGSCGTAAYRKEAVVVEDIASDPLWTNYRDAALAHGLRACWSTPIIDQQRRLLGTFAMYYRKPTLPQPEHQRLIEIATHIAAIAISRHRAEEALRLSEEKFMKAFCSSPDIIVLSSLADGRVAEVSDRLHQLTGYTPDEIVGKSTTELQFWANPADRERYMALLQRDGRVRELEVLFRIKSGEVRDALLTAEIIEIGNSKHILAVIRDVTTWKQSVEALRESEARFATLFRESPTGMMLSALENNTIVDVNTRFEALTGCRREELLGKTTDELATWTDPSTRERFLTMLQRDGLVRDFEATLRSRSGEVHATEVSAHIVTVQQKKHVLTSVQDITMRRQAEDAARRLAENLRERIAEVERAEHRYRLLVDNANDVIWVRDLDFRLTYVSPAVTRLRGTSVEEEMATSFEEMLTPASFALAQNVLQEELAREASGQADSHRARTLLLEFLRTDGSTFWGETTVTFVRDKAGRPTGILGATRDVTGRVRAEQAVRRALDGVVRTAGRIAELRDPYTAGHQRRTAGLACAIARELGLSKDQIEGLHVAALLHDIGKAAVPTEILAKPGALTEIELALVKGHPQTGYEILHGIEFPWPVAEIVRDHHERLNGSGYPRGRKGKEISVEARIVAVADVVEAMSSHRPYRPAHPPEGVLDEIRAHRGTLYDPHAVDACLKLFAQERFRFTDEERAATTGATA